MIKAFSNHGDFDKLWDLYSSLLSTKTYDEILFNSLLNVFADKEHESNLYEIYSEMKKNKINISIITYGVILKMYVNMANEERAEEIYAEILRKGFNPSIVIFQLMIKLYSYLGRISKVWKVYLIMKSKYQVYPDSQLYDSLIRINLKFNNLMEVKKLIVDAVGENTKIPYYLVDSFFQKLRNDGFMSLKVKKQYANEVSIAFGDAGLHLSTKAYQLMDNIFHYNSPSKYDNNNYNNYGMKDKKESQVTNKYDLCIACGKQAMRKIKEQRNDFFSNSNNYSNYRKNNYNNSFEDDYENKDNNCNNDEYCRCLNTRGSKEKSIYEC